MKSRKILKKIPYIYICSTLKDNSVRRSDRVLRLPRSYYKNHIDRFLNILSRLIPRGKVSYISKILDLYAGEPSQLRIIFRCPFGLSPDRFKEIAERAWLASEIAGTVIECRVARSVDMDLSFLEPSWDGRLKGA